MVKAIQAAFRARFMYGLVIPEYKAIHWAWNTAALYDWLLCYPAGTQVVLINVNDSLRFISRAA